MPFRDAWLVVGALLVLVGFAAAEPVVSAVGFVVLLIGGLSRYWSRHLFDRVFFHRRLGERRAFVDEPVALHLELENRKALPLPWYEWRLAMADPLRVEGESLASHAVPGLSWLVRRGAMGWYERRNWELRVRAAERGFHQVGPASISSADLLGVFPGQVHDDRMDHLLVFPRVFTMEELGLPPDRPFGERKGGRPIFEDPLRIAGLREYRPGDPLRRIDWKATARSNQLTSRVYEPSATHQLYLALNIDTMPHAWEGYLKDELERTVSTAASVASWAAGQRYSVGLIANGSYPDADRPIRLAPSRARDQLTRVLEALAVIQPLTMGDLASAILRETARIPSGSTIVVVASLIPEALGAVLGRLAAEGHQVFVLATSDRALDGLPPGIPVHTVARAFERMEVTV
ncbi:MAG: DUF58 domain-containing protein [Dehalococcoidia bacterium]|nr:DUF58 domain-containing protein [Dehalococcoidia bacterium]